MSAIDETMNTDDAKLLNLKIITVLNLMDDDHHGNKTTELIVLLFDLSGSLESRASSVAFLLSITFSDLLTDRSAKHSSCNQIVGFLASKRHLVAAGCALLREPQ